MKQIFKPLTILASFIYALSFFGCTDMETFLPDITSAFTYTVNADTGTVTFLNVSEGAQKYEWDFGDGEKSNEINPIKTYSASGTYTVTLKASNLAGASDTSEDEISIQIKEAVALPITFDNPNVNYDVATFDGTTFEIVDNPDVSGTNDKATRVGAITNSGNAFEGIFIDLGTAVDLAEGPSVTMNFWADAPVPVLLKLEEGTSGAVEIAANHGGTGWEALQFNFTSGASYSRLTLFVDGPGTTAGTFYVDDIDQAEGPGGGEDCVEETEQSLAAADFNLTFQTDPGSAIVSDGGAFSYIDNPDTDNEVNTSCKVGQIDRDPGLEFANTQINFDAKFDFNANAGFKLKVWAPAAGTNVLVKLEDQASDAATEVGATTTTANAWEELTFDFPASESGKYDRIVLFFELGTFTGETYYIDDFALYSEDGGGNELVDCGGELVNDFESADDSIFSNFGGGVGTVIDNPDTSVNTSAKVGQYVKNAGEVFAGITIEVDPDIDFNAGVFSIDVNSQAVRQLLFKLEGLGIEQVIPTSGTGWETLTYDFSSVAGNAGTVTAITLIMDNGTAGDGSADWTIQFDNIRLCSNGTGGGGDGNLATNGDFETGDDTGWFLFQNGGTASLDNTLNNGGAWSGRLTVGDTGGNPAFKQERIGAGTVQAGDVVQVQFDLIGSIQQPGAAVNVLLFGESAGGVSFTQVLTPAPVLEGSWTTYTGTFAIPAGTDVSEGISFLIEAVCGAVSGCNVTMNIDNVSVTLNP